MPEGWPVSLTLHAAPDAGPMLARAIGGRRGVARPVPMVPAAFDDERFVGTERRIFLRGQPLVVTLREGEIRHGRRRAPACLLHLEGDATSLGEVALQLAEAGAWLPAPSEPSVPELSVAQLPGEALALLIDALGTLIRHHAPSAAAGDSAEPVHQMRVAARRLRSATGLFRRVAACPGLAVANRELKTLMEKLSPARDWDVFLAGTGADIERLFPGQAAVSALLLRGRIARIEAYTALATHLADTAFRVMTVRLAWLAIAQPWETATDTSLDVVALAQRMLERRWVRMCGCAEAIETLPDAALHGLRLHAKRMRYACEFFEPLFSGRGARRWVRRLTRLQERLGALNDAVVASELMGRVTPEGDSFAGGVVRGYVAAAVDRARPRSLRAWRRLRRLEVFWD